MNSTIESIAKDLSKSKEKKKNLSKEVKELKNDKKELRDNNVDAEKKHFDIKEKVI